MKANNTKFFIVILLCISLSNSVIAQFAAYNFDNNINDQLNGHNCTYLELGSISNSQPIFGTSSNDMQIILDSTQGLRIPNSFNAELDISKSLEIDLTFSIKELGSGEGVTDLFTCQSQANEPGFTVYVLHSLFSSEENYKVIFSYADGGFNQGVPDHPGHDATIIGEFFVDDVVNLKLILDFENRVWSSLVNGSYTSLQFDDYYDWDFMLNRIKSNPYFVGWRQGQEDDMLFNPTYFTSVASFDELKVFSPRQNGNTGILQNALVAMKSHVDNSTPLSLVEREELLTNIYLNYFGNFDLVKNEVFDFINAYELNNDPVFNDRRNVAVSSLAPEVQLLIFLQQTIFDEEYGSENIANMEGIAFEFADIFPGKVDPNAARVMDASVEVNATYNHNPAVRMAFDLFDAKRPTGFYAAPGELVNINLPASYINAGLKVMIGAHDRDHSSLSVSNRFDRISKDFALDSENTTIVSPFGGAIYIKVPESTDLGWIDIGISGAVAAPYFSRRTGRNTSISDFNAALDQGAVQWVDLEADKFMMTLPLNHVRDIADPDRLLKEWNDIMDAYRYVGGRPAVHNKAEYFMIDSRLPNNSFGTGYPQIIGESNAPLGPFNNTELYATQILNPKFHESNFHITFHELGHLVLHPTPPNEVETNIHNNAVYIYNVLYDIPLDSAFMHSSGERHTLDEAAIDWMIAENFRQGYPMDCDPTMDFSVCDELRYQHRGHAKYVKMAELFGWSAVHEMNKFFHDDRTNNNPNDWARVTTDNVIRAASEGTGFNMAPLMHFWGFHPSFDLIEELDVMPRSGKILQMLEYYKALTPNSIEEFQPWYDSNFPKKDPVHHERYNIALAEYESEDYGPIIKLQIDYLIDLYFPGGVSTDDLANINTKVFPNPVTDVINIEFENQEKVQIKVIDINGKTIFQKDEFQGSYFQFELLGNSGIYFLEIISDNERSVHKLIKK